MGDIDMPIGREPGDSTMIRVSWDTKEELNALKRVTGKKVEAVGDVVKRILHENKVLQTEKSNLLKQIQALSMPFPGGVNPVILEQKQSSPMPKDPTGEMPK